MPNRLNLEYAPLFPVQAFFNAISDDSLIRAVGCLTNGIGYCSNEVACNFTADLDPDEEPFDGVRFSLFEDSIIISLEQLRHFLELVCSGYVDNHPQDKQKINDLLARMSQQGEELK